MLKVSPAFQKEAEPGPRIWEVQSQCPALWFEQPWKALPHSNGGHAALTLGPGVALSRSWAGDALTSQVPPADGHKALEEHFAGVLTRRRHAMQPDEQHPMAMLLVALGAWGP